MWDQRRQAWAVLLLANVLMNTVVATPIYVPQFLPGSAGKNMRHMPCVSRRSGEIGVCMFAIACAKANGTHLGTCIDRFYFGSCCKIDEEPAFVSPQDNAIDDGTPPRPFVSTAGPIESNDIPEYFPRPKPIDEGKPPATHTTPEVTTAGTQKTESTSGIVVTKRPVLTTVETTTQSVRLSTFQTVQNDSKHSSTVGSTVKGTSSTPPQTQKTSSTVVTAKRPSTSSSSVVHKPTTLGSVTKITETVTETVTETSKPMTKRPTPTVPRPTHSTSQKATASSTPRPTETTTRRTVLTSTQRIVPLTRFPPRNSTTSRPATQPTTRRPVNGTKRPTSGTSTKRPTVSTKKPSSPTKRPASPKPATTPISSAPTTTTANFTPQTTKARPTTVPTTAGTPLASTEGPSALKDKATTTGRTTESDFSTTVRTTVRTTSQRPLTSGGSRPRPASSTTTKTVSKPEHVATTEKIWTTLTTGATTASTTRRKPTTTRPTTTHKPQTKPLSSTTTVRVTSTTSSTTESVVATVSVPLSTLQKSNETTENVTQPTHSPGLVTWSSSSDDMLTKPPAPATSTSFYEGGTETEWKPITTPGWIMIESPTTEKSSGTVVETDVETTTKPVVEPTEQPLTSAVTESTAMENVTDKMSPLTTQSSVPNVTLDPDQPVPIETFNMLDYKQVCGRRMFPEPRIVGGNPSSFGKWPWQISLRQWRTSTYLHKCGAALLNENWAITAAHCVESVPPSDLLLRIGEHDLTNEQEPYGYQERRVQIVASHPQFDPRTFEYDLALLRFYEPLLPFQPNALPICLPDDDETYVGRTAYVTGWGRLYDEGPLPSTLQEVSVPVINNTVCESMYKKAGYSEHIPHIFICAGWRNGGFDSCEGDSGGPMVIQRARDKRWILAGVISWGIGCAVPNQPGVYTRISEFREWISQILKF